MSAPARRGMGRGLAAILPQPGETGEPALRYVPPALVLPNPSQPRRRFDPQTISALADSLREAGVIQPLIVRPLSDGRYEIIAGERRWRAATEAGLETIPVLLRTEEEPQRLQTALIENVAREQLNPVDEARACLTLVEDLGLTREELARRLGRSRAALSNLIRILDLPDEALALIESGELSEGHGRALLIAKSAEERQALARHAAAAGWSVRETERRANAGTTARPKLKAVPDPDLVDALEQAEDALERALGRGIRIRPVGKNGAIRAELRFDDLDELEAFVEDRRA
ncbi:MAG: ParB/RepB/Spo0J family partition protein [Actinomycetota bacterium]|nr:ParB/RepB/Spo0J family partition protein [Actinomycetota bacterium]